MNSEEEQEARYFPVSIAKLVAMDVCTLGVYQIYWSWHCWEYVKARDGKKFNSAWRAVTIFAIFFNFVLFWDVARHAGLSKPQSLLRSVGLGLSFSGFWILGGALQDGRWAPIILLSSLVFIPVQAQINRINETEAPGHDPNRRLSTANSAAIVLGGSLLLIALVGAVLGPE
jgi:hypothetical protein